MTSRLLAMARPVRRPGSSGSLRGPILGLRYLAVGTCGWVPLSGAAVSGAEQAARPRAHLQSVAELAEPPASAEGLGVSLSRAPGVLRRQLGLVRGAGLVADQVKPGSAAARAGFLQHDVLVRLDDQILVLPDQFDALLESAEPGDALACTVLRGGREVVIPLGLKPSDLPQAAIRQAAMPPEPIRPVGGLRPTASTLALIAPAHSPGSSAGPLRQLARETLVRNDPDYQIRLSRGDDTQLTVTDRAGQIVFHAAIDSAADRDRVPLAVRTRVADMEKLLEPRESATGNRVVPASAVAGPQSEAATRIGRLDVSPVELR